MAAGANKAAGGLDGGRRLYPWQEGGIRKGGEEQRRRGKREQVGVVCHFIKQVMCNPLWGVGSGSRSAFDEAWCFLFALFSLPFCRLLTGFCCFIPVPVQKAKPGQGVNDL